MEAEISKFYDLFIVSTQSSFKVIPKDKDKFWARVKSSAVCASPDSAESNTILFNVITPTIPTISVSGNILTSSASIGNQWYKDSEIIQSAVNQIYIAKDIGTYKVAVNDGIYPTQISNNISVVINGNELLNKTSTTLTLYPNPASESIHISAAKDYQQFSIYHSTGQKVLETKAIENLDVLALSEAIPARGNRCTREKNTEEV